MTKPLCGTVKERIAIFFYRISLLQMQIQGAILSEASSQKPTAAEDVQGYQNALAEWLQDWRAEFAPEAEHISADSHTQPFLDAWADLHYCHASFLMASFRCEASYDTSSNDHLLQCGKLIQACSFLARHEKKALLLGQTTVAESPAPIFPIDWTSAQLIFSVGLRLSALIKQRARSPNDKESAIVRQCLTVLALLEGDATHLCTGFSELLEVLFLNEPSN
jgi:hypothetical protein